jgi:hypothetical protein
MATTVRAALEVRRGDLLVRPAFLSVLLWALVAGPMVGATACSTVELGDPPADVNACRPSQMFFADRVWPEFLSKDYGGKTCGAATCHDAVSPVLAVPMSTPTPAIPFPGGSDWEMIYRAAAQRMTCTNVRGSELFTRPSGLRPHGGGALIDPVNGPEGPLLDMWVAAP